MRPTPNTRANRGLSPPTVKCGGSLASTPLAKQRTKIRSFVSRRENLMRWRFIRKPAFQPSHFLTAQTHYHSSLFPFLTDSSRYISGWTLMSRAGRRPPKSPRSLASAGAILLTLGSTLMRVPRMPTRPLSKGATCLISSRAQRRSTTRRCCKCQISSRGYCTDCETRSNCKESNRNTSTSSTRRRPG